MNQVETFSETLEMKLKVLLPTEVALEQEVLQVTAEAENGWFSLKPRHLDFVTALVPGVLLYRTADGQEGYLAINAGILVKCGPEVLVSTRQAVSGLSLDELQTRVEEQFRQLNEQEEQVRSASARLEAHLVRRFIDLRKPA